MNHVFKPLHLHDLTLLATRIDVWHYPLHTEFPLARASLSPDEQARCERYYFSKHQRRFAVARAMLRIILARYLQTSPTSFQFSDNDYGKPFLPTSPQLHFNVSHSKDWALLAIGWDHPLGIDLEWMSARPYLGIAQNMFSPHEINQLKKVPLHLRPLAFFNTWSQKEALIKACGLGLSYPTQSFDVNVMSPKQALVLDTLHNQTWSMISFMPHVNCCAALCHHPGVTDVRYHRLAVAGAFEC